MPHGATKKKKKVKEKLSFLKQTKIEGIYCQYTCLARNVKRSSLKKRKIIQAKISNEYKERKNTRKGIIEGKIKTLIFIILNNSKTVFNYYASVCVCVCTQAHLRQTMGSILDYQNKADIAIKLVTQIFFPVHIKFMLKNKTWDFPSGLVAKTLHSQCSGPGFNLWSGNYIPHATTKSSQATAKDLACHN